MMVNQVFGNITALLFAMDPLNVKGSELINSWHAGATDIGKVGIDALSHSEAKGLAKSGFFPRVRGFVVEHPVATTVILSVGLVAGAILWYRYSKASVGKSPSKPHISDASNFAFFEESRDRRAVEGSKNEERDDARTHLPAWAGGPVDS